MARLATGTITQTAASNRARRSGSFTKSSTLKKSIEVSQTATSVRGRGPASNPAIKDPSSAIAGAIVKKRKHRAQSAAAKAKRAKDAAKARKAKEIERTDVRAKKSSADATDAIKIYNNELKTDGLEWEAEEILDSKLKKGELFYLVKWMGYPDDDNTWEPAAHLSNSGELIQAFDIAFPFKP